MNQIHPTAAVDPDVVLGDDNVIGAFAVLAGPLVLGDRNWIGPHAIIGTPGEVRGGAHPAAGPQPAQGDAWSSGRGVGVRIGSGNVIRETVTVHSGTQQETVIGDNCYLMARAHVPHDAVLGDGVTMSDTSQIGGHCRVGHDATLGLGAVVHQWLVIGAGAMIGMQAAVTKDVPPYAMVTGVPGRIRGANRRRLLAAGHPEDLVDAIEQHLAGDALLPALPPSLAADWAAFMELAGAHTT